MGKDTFEVMWLGQGGFLLEAMGTRLVVDPYLSDSLADTGFTRMIPLPVDLGELRPDAVCCTHDHRDHFDAPTMSGIHRLYPCCTVAGPVSVTRHASELGFEQSVLVTMAAGGEYCFGAFLVRPTVAFHSDKWAVGLVVEAAGRLVYISGDTTSEPGLAEDVRRVAGRDVDAVMICINGKLGNMSWEEAAEVVAELRPSVAVPMHYGMFAGNTADPEPFRAKVEAAGLKCMIMEPGKTIKL